jgi:hypothetical protein
MNHHYESPSWQSSSSSSSFSSYRCGSYAATGRCVSTCFYFPIKVLRNDFDIHCSHCTKIPHTSNNFLKRGWNHNWSQRRHPPPSFQSPTGRRFSRPCTTCPTYPILLANSQEKNAKMPRIAVVTLHNGFVMFCLMGYLKSQWFIDSLVHHHLVGGTPTPEKYEFVNWDYCS